MIRYNREERYSFSTFLPINVLLIVLGIIVNLAICFVMIRKTDTEEIRQIFSFSISP